MRLASKQARDFCWQTVIRLHKEGKNQQQIAAILLLAQSNVSRILQKYAVHPQVPPAYQSSRWRQETLKRRAVGAGEELGWQKPW